MGWLYGSPSRESLIRELTAPIDGTNVLCETVAYRLCGEVLWSVVRVTAKQDGAARMKSGESTSIIRCDLINNDGGDWGSKPLDESMRPYYYDCPLEFLELAPELNPEWRAEVRRYHARQASVAA